VNCRFAGNVQIPDSLAAAQAKLFAVLDGRERIEMAGYLDRKMRLDPFHSLFRKFVEGLGSLASGKVLEVGARNRSGAVRRGLIPPNLAYTGMDIMPGENVDVVGDAHELGSYFAPESFDAIFAMSTVEHLLMPWKFAIEANHVLKPGGLIMLTTHQSWPLHERPWDFWRFSDHSWAALFNRCTGFQILETAMGEPASIVPHFAHPITCTLESQPAYLTCAVKARKIGKTALEWPVKIADALDNSYPA
jgi:SAM-dependent methyltransferase